MSAMTVADLPQRRFTVDEYQQMGRAGVLSPDDRTELLDGKIVMMSPIKPRHGGVVNALNELLVTSLAGRAVVTIQNPVVLGKYSEPEPDVVIANPRADYYQKSHPRPDDILLLIEVADTSLATDRAVKLPLYARADVREVWIIDVNSSLVLVHTEPRSGDYTSVREVWRGEVITPRLLPDVAFEVNSIVG